MATQKAPAQRNNSLFNQPRAKSTSSASDTTNQDLKGDPIKCYTRRSVEEHQARVAAKREWEDLFGPE